MARRAVVMVQHAGKVLTRQFLIRQVWGAVLVRNMLVLVRQLRQKIDPDPNRPEHILRRPAWAIDCASPTDPGSDHKDLTELDHAVRRQPVEARGVRAGFAQRDEEVVLPQWHAGVGGGAEAAPAQEEGR